MTEQALETLEITDEMALEMIASIKEQAKTLIGDYVYYELLGHSYVSGQEQLRPSNTFLEELYGDINDFLMTYRHGYIELFELDDDTFDIINETYATLGPRADDLIDWLDDVFVTEFLNIFAEVAGYPSQSAKLSGEQLVRTVFETLQEHQDKFTDDETIYDGLVTVYIRALLLNHAEQLDNLTEDDIKNTMLNVLNIPKDILSC